MTMSLLTPTSLPVTALFQLWSQALSCSSALLARLRVAGEWAAYRLKECCWRRIPNPNALCGAQGGKAVPRFIYSAPFSFPNGHNPGLRDRVWSLQHSDKKKITALLGRKRGLCHASAIIMMAGGTENSGPSPKGSGQGRGGGWDRSFSTASEALPRLPWETAWSLQSRAGCGQERPSACVGLVGAGESEGL